MSAKKAAASLIANDRTLATQVESILTTTGLSYLQRRAIVANLLRETMGTWTLTLAADAAGVTEEQVIAAMAYHPSLRVGSTSVAQSLAHELYNENGPRRQIATMAARNVFLHGAQAGMGSVDDRLLAEAKATDHFSCSDQQMLEICRAEYRKVEGQSLGGYVTSTRMKSAPEPTVC